MVFANAGDLVRRDRDLAKIALVDLGDERAPREFSFAALDAMANGVARALAKRGLGRGDRVAILAANRAEYLASVYGIMRAGFVAVPVNFKFPRATIEFILADCGARLVLCDGPRRADCPAGLPVVVFGEGGADRSTASSIPARSPPSRRWRTSPRSSSTPRARPAAPRASCCRMRGRFGWSRRGSGPR